MPRAELADLIKDLTAQMMVAAQTLHGGQYKVVIRGGDREIVTYPFTVEVQ